MTSPSSLGEIRPVTRPILPIIRWSDTLDLARSDELECTTNGAMNQRRRGRREPPRRRPVSPFGSGGRRADLRHDVLERSERSPAATLMGVADVVNAEGAADDPMRVASRSRISAHGSPTDEIVYRLTSASRMA